VHTAIIYARARAEHARRIAAAALIAAAAVTPAAAWDCTSTCSPKPRPSYIGSQSDKGAAPISAAQYHRELDRLSDTMANVQRGYLAGTISQREYEAAQVRHGAAVLALQARRSSSGGLSYGVGGNSSDPNNCRQRCN
jgi:hypothetical protein